jgi:hypothetical protein
LGGGDQPQDRAGLADLALQAGVDGQGAGLLGSALGFLQIALVPVDEPPGQQRPRVVRRGGRLLSLHRQGPLVQRDRGWLRPDPEVGAEPLAQPFELSDGCPSVANLERGLHERTVGLLVGAVEL